MLRTVTAFIATVLVCQPVHAQFAPPRAKASGAGSANVVRPVTRSAQEAQQRRWIAEATRSEMTRLEMMPRARATTVQVQQAVTSYAAAGQAVGYARDWTPDDCEAAIRSAERKYNLPPYLLAAIALTESGRDGRPSPVAMNIAGRTYFAQDTSDMEATVAKNGGSAASIDVGCLQLNLRWHAARFKDWRSLLVPRYNAQYAALYLVELHREYGTWTGAVGAYHNRTPWRSANYACLVSRRWSQIFGWTRPGCGADIEAMAAYMRQSQRS